MEQQQFSDEHAISMFREMMSAKMTSLWNESCLSANDIAKYTFKDLFQCMFAAYYGYSTVSSLLNNEKFLDFCNDVGYKVETFFPKES